MKLIGLGRTRDLETDRIGKGGGGGGGFEADRIGKDKGGGALRLTGLGKTGRH